MTHDLLNYVITTVVNDFEQQNTFPYCLLKQRVTRLISWMSAMIENYQNSYFLTKRYIFPPLPI